MEQMEQLIQYFIFNIQFQMSCRFIILNIWKCLNGYSIAIDVFLANLNQSELILAVYGYFWVNDIIIW